MTYGQMRVKSLWPKNEGIVVVPLLKMNLLELFGNVRMAKLIKNCFMIGLLKIGMAIAGNFKAVEYSVEIGKEQIGNYCVMH